MLLFAGLLLTTYWRPETQPEMGGPATGFPVTDQEAWTEYLDQQYSDCLDELRNGFVLETREQGRQGRAVRQQGDTDDLYLLSLA